MITFCKVLRILLWLLPFSRLAFAAAAPADTQSADQTAKTSPKKEYQNIPIGPLRLDLGGSIRLRHEYQAGFDVHKYAPGTRDQFLLERIMIDINFYGDLNLFFWPNLRDYEWDLHLQPARTVKLFLEHHYFMLDQARDAWYTTGLSALRRDAGGLSGKSLGHEINLRFLWQLANGPEIFIGWRHFFPGDYVRATGSAKPASGYFLQISYGL
jgi:hypothetical protein